MNNKKIKELTGAELLRKEAQDCDNSVYYINLEKEYEQYNLRHERLCNLLTSYTFCDHTFGIDCNDDCIGICQRVTSYGSNIDEVMSLSNEDFEKWCNEVKLKQLK